MKTWFLAGALALAACATTKPAPTADTTPAPAAEAKPEAHTNVQPVTSDATGGTKAFDHKPKVGEKAICAVSGEAFEVTESTKVAEYNGKYYAFCCDECEPSFKADPAKYAN
jgi:YHS domain-containing protein